MLIDPVRDTTARRAFVDSLGSATLPIAGGSGHESHERADAAAEADVSDAFYHGPSRAPAPVRADWTLTMQWIAPRLPRRRLGWIVGAVLAFSLAILVGALIATRITAEPEASVAGTPAAPGLGAPPPATISTIPSFSVASLPSAGSIGTIAVKGKTRLVIDGAAVRGSTQVTCGAHTVLLGASKKPRTVQVPCGGTVTLP